MGWQDASGAWVTVVNSEVEFPSLADRLTPAALKAQLLDVAADVRLGAPEDMLVPVHFPVIPDDLLLSFADVDETTGKDPTHAARLGFGGPAAPSVELFRAMKMRDTSPLSITAMSTGGAWFEYLYSPVNTEVAGRPARYYENSDEGSVTVPDGGSVLLVEIGTCGIAVAVQDRTRITRAELETMFTGATFDECDTTKTWTRPLR